MVWGPEQTGGAVTNGASRMADRLGRLVLFMQSVELSLFTIDRNGSLILFLSKLWEKDSELIAK